MEVHHPIAAGNRLDGADAGAGLDARLSCCVCWPGVRRRAVKAEPALTPGRGGAQRSRLDLIRLDSATQRTGTGRLDRLGRHTLAGRLSARGYAPPLPDAEPLDMSASLDV